MEKYLFSLPIDIYIYVNYLKKNEKTNEYQMSNAKDFSFEGLMIDLMNASLMKKIQLNYRNHNWSVNWIIDKGVEISAENGVESICILESGMQTIWDYVKEERVFSEDRLFIDRNLFFELLFFMGYLSKVKLQNEEMRMNMGFQLNDAKRRKYIYRGG